jgi:hypothetical protein
MPDKTVKLFPQGPGQKLSPKIPSYFPSFVLYSQSTDGKRTIHTASTPLMDLATPAPFLIDKSYPAETGLAAIFAALKENRSATKEESKVVQATPKLLRRT